MLEIFGVIVVFVGVFAFVIYKRGTDLQKLVANGVETKATVEKILHFNDSAGLARYRLRYLFVTANGKEYRRTVSISPGEREQITEGVQLPVIYLENNPKINALSELVAQASKALGK